MEAENIIQNSKENKIKEINQLGEIFKSNLLKDAVLNSVILVLIGIFFSILFEFTQKIVIDFVKLSWSDIFPMLLDLGALTIIGITINSVKKLLSNDKLVLKLNDEEEHINEKISFFLQEKNEDLSNLLISIIIFSILYFCGVEFLDSINHKFSILNNWYFEKFYESLPIYPLNIVMLVIILAILIPINKAIYNYRKKLSNYLIKIEQTKFQTEEDEKIKEMNYTRTTLFLLLIIFCIILSFAKQNNSWNFKYLQSHELLNLTINEQTSIKNVDIKLLCKLDRKYVKSHSKIKLSYTYFKYGNTGSERINENELITEKTKDDLENYCNKHKEN